MSLLSRLLQAVFAGDNFFRYSGEAPDVQKLQLFAWQAAARGNDVHLNANPTQGEILHQEFRQKRDELKDTSKVSILAKYGGAEYLDAGPKELLQGQTEDYVEYSRTGLVIKGRERSKVKSKYLEDGGIRMSTDLSYRCSRPLNAVPVNNHTAVWGSWYDLSSGVWGYACCHSTIHVSYCSGQAGIEVAQASSAPNLLTSASVTSGSVSLIKKPSTIKTGICAESRDELAQKVGQNYSKKRVGDGDVKLDKELLQRAITAERKRKLTIGDDDHGRLSKKGKNALEGGNRDVTEEELGA